MSMEHKADTVIYSFFKFIALLRNTNPNMFKI